VGDLAGVWHISNKDLIERIPGREQEGYSSGYDL